MRTIKYSVVAFVALSLLLVPKTSKADSVLVASGSLVAIGNPVCTLSPCTQTLDFAIQLAPYFDETQGIVPNFKVVDFSGGGPLGHLDGTPTGEVDPINQNLTFGTMYLGDGLGDEVDVVYSVFADGSGYDFSMGQGFFYQCTSTTCVSDFTYDGNPCINLSCQAPLFNLQSFTVSQVPEPPATYLVASGLVLLLLIAAVFPEFRRKIGRHLSPDALFLHTTELSNIGST